jgi:hypothetical protein
LFRRSGKRSAEVNAVLSCTRLFPESISAATDEYGRAYEIHALVQAEGEALRVDFALILANKCNARQINVIGFGKLAKKKSRSNGSYRFNLGSDETLSRIFRWDLHLRRGQRCACTHPRDAGIVVNRTTAQKLICGFHLKNSRSEVSSSVRNPSAHRISGAPGR